ncbi:MAG: hypothetical protein ACI841_000336 [Planctomycetota bacterium]|jgi:hypothetical protein
MRSLALGCALLFSSLSFAQSTQATSALNETSRSEIIDAVLKALNDNYVFPKVAKKMEAAVREKAKSGRYDQQTDGRRLTDLLQSDLRDICQDKHLTIHYSDTPMPMQHEEAAPETDDPNAPPLDQWAQRLRRQNWGFRKVEILDGNIGYLDLRAFAPVNKESSQVAAGAMSFLASSDALIVDLRQNGGGAPAMVAFLTTYLFGEEPVHLNSLEEPRRGTSHQWWTLPIVPGLRFGPDKPVFILTSRFTFSAAEEYSYNLLNLERATLIGETTGGGAHPVESVIVHPHVSVGLPFARAVNPISGTNWEGTGVEPHISIDANDALGEAHLNALDGLIDAAGDSPERDALLQVAKRLESSF